MKSDSNPKRYTTRTQSKYTSSRVHHSYYSDLSILKKIHSRLYEKEPKFSIARRYVSNTKYGVVEATLRVPASYPTSLKTLVGEKLISLIKEFGNYGSDGSGFEVKCK